MRFTDIPAPRVLCSITGISAKDVDETFSFVSSDPNSGKVAQLYHRSGLVTPHEFVSLIATQTAPKSNAIQAYGAKSPGTVRRVSENLRGDLSAVPKSLDLRDLFPTGVVLVLNDAAKLDIRVGAAEDISTLASKVGGTLIQIAGSLDHINQSLCELDDHARLYAEVRIHRPITSADVLEVYSLSDFRQYCIQ
jgi:hypothetical protein